MSQENIGDRGVLVIASENNLSLFYDFGAVEVWFVYFPNMLPYALLAFALLPSAIVAKTYDLCPNYYDNRGSGIVFDRDTGTRQSCIEGCDTGFDGSALLPNGCQTFSIFAFTGQDPQCNAASTLPSLNQIYNATGISDLDLTIGYPRSDAAIPARSPEELFDTCVVCKTETCFSCIAPSVFSVIGNCLDRCPPGQLANGGRGCVPCADAECTGRCTLPEYYSSEAGACVLPTVITESPMVTSTSTVNFETVTVRLVSTTTPATATITALTTAFTGRAACSYYRVTFPADCCPNKYVTGLRRVRIRRDDSKLERRTIAFTTTTLATATATRTVKGRSPPVSLTVVSFVEASTPLTTTSTTAFAQSTACISTTRTGFGRCPTDPRTAVEALLKKYQESGERVVIDCGATGLYEQA